MTSRVWAVVPVKRLDRAKSRLGAVLCGADRMVLARCMLGDVLRALRATASLAGIVVVSADPVVHAIARSSAARPVCDVGESGINDAVAQGLQAVPPGAGVVVVPADVPLATAAEFERVVALLDADPVVLAPALADGGTNALAMRSATLLPPQFGERSFERHRLVAGDRGLRCGVFRSDRLGRDIDEARDLDACLAAPADGSETAGLLRRWQRQGRLGAAMAVAAGRP